MSEQYNGRNMDRPTPGSVRRARERAQAGLPRQPFSIDRPQVTPDSAPTPVNATAPRQRPMAPLAASSRLPIPNPSLAGDDQATRSMSRPMQPQWPLPGPSISPVTSNKPPRNAVTSERNKQAPPRPPRPSQIPLVVEQPRLQPPRPIYVARPNVPDSPDDINDNFDSSSIEETPSRRTLSSIGSIPDFPPPATSGAPGPPRRSAILGPPPSSRRGASSFYSNASFVSPIPEESPRSRSHGSYASSAAMPEGWTASSPLASPLDSEGYYDDAASESSRESLFEDLGDESRLVQDVPQKKRGAIAGNPLRTAGNTGSSLKIVTTPSQLFRGGTGYMDRSTTSLPLPTSSMPTAANGPAKLGSNALTSDAILKAYTAASLSDLADARAAASYRSSNRFSNLRRPPRLDIDAVREAEARGSLTSLPELIRRATRLASMIDKGKRPASRMDELDGFFGGNEKASRDGDGSISDMLAAFPPPVHTPRNNSRSRGSFIRPDSSWPMVGIQGQQSRARAQSTHLESGAKQKKRRCCGLPTWAVTLLVILILCAIVAAIVIPLEFFVFKNLGNKGNKDESLENCRKSLTCRNGGVNMISAGTCSCICTNGFTGPDCNSGGSPGCTSTDLVATDGSTSISNVTLGKALPRLMADAQRNFSVPLSGNTILGKLNSGGLSCIAQNSLVTFNGQPSGAVLESEAALDSGNRQSIGLLNVQKDDEVVFPPVSVISYTPQVPPITATPYPGYHSPSYVTTTTTTTLIPKLSASPILSTIIQTMTVTTSDSTSTRPTLTKPTSLAPTPTSAMPTSATSTTADVPVATPSGLFTVTQQVLDFARVATLYILQEDSVDAASAAQSELQRLFSRSNTNKSRVGDPVTRREASDVRLGGNRSINLTGFSVDVGKGPIGKNNIGAVSDGRGSTT